MDEWRCKEKQFDYSPIIALISQIGDKFTHLNGSMAITNAMTEIKQLKPHSRNIIQVIGNFFKSIYNAVSFVFTTIGQTITRAIAILMPSIIKIHSLLIHFPLYIPFLTSYLERQLGSKITLMDFFIIPISQKINKHFKEYNLEINMNEINDILSSSLASPNLPYHSRLKWHYISQYALHYFKLFQVPFMGLQLIPIVGKLNPLLNISPYLSTLLEFPYDIMEQSLDDLDLFILSLIPVAITVVPDNLIPFSDIVIDLITTTLYGIPLFLETIHIQATRTIDDLPERYQNKKKSLFIHNSIEILLSLPLLMDMMINPVYLGLVAIPFQVIMLGLAMVEAYLGIGMVSKAISWNSTVFILYG